MEVIRWLPLRMKTSRLLGNTDVVMCIVARTCNRRAQTSPQSEKADWFVVIHSTLVVGTRKYTTEPHFDPGM